MNMETKQPDLVRHLIKVAHEHGVIAEIFLKNTKIPGIDELLNVKVTVEILEL